MERIQKQEVLMVFMLAIIVSIAGFIFFTELRKPNAPNENPPSPQSLVKFKDSKGKQAFLAANNLKDSDVKKSALNDTYVVKVPNNKLKSDGAIVAPRREYKALLVPNDPLYPQWYTSNIGAPSAWDVSTGSSAVTVAVIDTGFGLSHEDMANRWALNAGESGGGKETNGIDDDSNGKIDDWRGWDFLHGDNNPNAGSTNANGQAVSHGTMTSGLVGATGNNSKGVASINWGVKIMPLQVLSDDGSGFTDDVTAALNYAVANGATVVSMSLGSAAPDPTFEAALNNAVNNGVTVLAAAGNCGDPNTYFINGCSVVGQMLYPAKYSSVIAVGATDQNDARASFSSYGSELDIMAPGSGTIQAPVWSQGNQTTGYSSSAFGTSIATPIAAGVAALYKGIVTSASVSEITQVLQNSTDKVAGMNGQNYTNDYGYGRIDAYGVNRLASVTHSNGTLITNRATGAVYLIENGQKRYIADPGTFLSYYRDVLAQAKTATPRDLDLADGTNLAFHSGTVVKGSGLALYVVADVGGTLYKQYIPSPDVHNALGFSEAERVPVSDSFLSSLPDGSTLSTVSQHANGSLVIAPDKQTVYLILSNQKHHVSNPYILQSLNKGKYFIKPATAADMALVTGSAVNYEEGALLKGSAPSIYITHLNGGVIEKQHITSPFLYALLNYQPNEWINVPDAGLPATTGAAIN